MALQHRVSRENKNRGGETPPNYGLLLSLFLTFLCLVAPVCAAGEGNFTTDFNTSQDEVHYNVTSLIDPGRTTPIEIWGIAGILGVVLLILSLQVRTEQSDIEKDAIISVIAWVPIGFTAYASFAVERVTSYGVTAITESGVSEYVLMENRIIYHFDSIGIIYGILFAVAVINTFRILALHKAMKLQNDPYAYR